MKAGKQLRSEIKRLQGETGGLIWDRVRIRARITVKTHLVADVRLRDRVGSPVRNQMAVQAREMSRDS